MWRRVRGKPTPTSGRQTPSQATVSRNTETQKTQNSGQQGNTGKYKIPATRNRNLRKRLRCKEPDDASFAQGGGEQSGQLHIFLLPETFFKANMSN